MIYKILVLKPCYAQQININFFHSSFKATNIPNSPRSGISPRAQIINYWRNLPSYLRYNFPRPSPRTVVNLNNFVTIIKLWKPGQFSSERAKLRWGPSTIGKRDNVDIDCLGHPGRKEKEKKKDSWVEEEKKLGHPLRQMNVNHYSEERAQKLANRTHEHTHKNGIQSMKNPLFSSFFSLFGRNKK